MSLSAARTSKGRFKKNAFKVIQPIRTQRDFAVAEMDAFLRCTVTFSKIK